MPGREYATWLLRDPTTSEGGQANVAPALLGLTLGCLVVGGSLHIAGAVVQGDLAWVIGGTAGAAYSLWTMIDSLRRGRLGVDAIAFLALVGALAVGEYLAAAVVAVMSASGRALEGWGGRACPARYAFLVAACPPHRVPLRG